MVSENTTTLELAGTGTDVPDTAANLTAYRQRGKRNMSKTGRSKEPISKAEAAAILASAVGICQEAGIVVQALEHSGTLWLAFPDFALKTEHSGTSEFVYSGTPENIVAQVDTYKPTKKEIEYERNVETYQE